MFSEHDENPPYFISNILPAKEKVYMSDCFGNQVNTKEDIIFTPVLLDLLRVGGFASQFTWGSVLWHLKKCFVITGMYL